MKGIHAIVNAIMLEFPYNPLFLEAMACDIERFVVRHEYGVYIMPIQPWIDSACSNVESRPIFDYPLSGQHL